MFISVLSVKLKISTYTGIHKMTLQYRDVITEGLDDQRKAIEGSSEKNQPLPWKACSVYFSVFS